LRCEEIANFSSGRKGVSAEKDISLGVIAGTGFLELFCFNDGDLPERGVFFQFCATAGSRDSTPVAEGAVEGRKGRIENDRGIVRYRYVKTEKPKVAVRTTERFLGRPEGSH
jgi:hypothetical protein